MNQITLTINNQEIKTEAGKWEGLSIELWQAVAEELGIEYEFKEFSRLKQVIEATQNEALDVTPMMAVTEPRRISRSTPSKITRSPRAKCKSRICTTVSCMFRPRLTG